MTLIRLFRLARTGLATLVCLIVAGTPQAMGQAAPVPEPVTTVGFGADSKHLLMASSTTIELWDIAERRLAGRLALSPSYAPNPRVLSPDGQFLVMSFPLDADDVPSGTDSAQPHLESHVIDLATGAVMPLDPVEPGSVHNVAFSGDGELLARATLTGDKLTVQLWRRPFVEMLDRHELRRSVRGPIVLALSPTGDRFALAAGSVVAAGALGATDTGFIGVHDAGNGRQIAAIETPHPPLAVAFSPDGRELYWRHAGGAHIQVSDARSGLALRVLGRPPDAPVGSLAQTAPTLVVSADPARIVTSALGAGGLEIWEPTGASPLGAIPVEGALSVAVNRDGRFVTVGTEGGAVLVDVSQPAAPQFALAVSLASPPRPTQGLIGLLSRKDRPADPTFAGGAERIASDDAIAVDPVAVRSVTPNYTQEALRRRISGLVVLEIEIRPNGTVGDVRVVHSLDAEYGLDQQAIAAAKQWRFTPARDASGKAIAVISDLQLTFKMRP